MNMRRHQSGFTLVEILVALLIGLFLAAGMVEMTQHNKATYSNQSLLAQLQDNQRFALSVLNDVIQAAGYYPDPTFNNAATDMPVNALYPQFALAGQPLAGTPWSAGAPFNTAASISVQYALATNDVVQSCAGQQNTVAGAPTAYVNTFNVVPPTAPNALDGQLTCTVTTSAGAQAPVVLVTGVTDMQIRYGINDTGSTSTHDVTEYKTASQMAGNDWMNVTSVQVTLSFQNPLYGQPGQTNAPINIVRTIGVMTRVGVTT
jgi:type IV pilus assembly protein PilW